MNLNVITDHVPTFKDTIQRQVPLRETSAIDIFTAFHLILKEKVVDNYTDNKYFLFLMAVLRNVPCGDIRYYWIRTMIDTFEKLAGVSSTDPYWLLLQANLMYLAPY